MSFALGKTTLEIFKDFIHYLVKQNWKASADDLRTTKWCQVEARNRCNGDANLVQKGCGCTGMYSKKCDTLGSACCQAEETCCKGIS